MDFLKPAVPESSCMIKRISGLLLLCILLAGCATASRIAGRSPERIAERVTISDPRQDGEVTISGRQIDTYKVLVGPSTYWIRSWKNLETGAVRHQLVVAMRYEKQEAHEFKFVRLGNQETNRAEVIASSSQCRSESPIEISRQYEDNYGLDLPSHRNVRETCTFREVLGVALEDQYLKDHRDTGFQASLTALTGVQMTVTVPASYIQAQFLAIRGRAEQAEIERPTVELEKVQ